MHTYIFVISSSFSYFSLCYNGYIPWSKSNCIYTEYNMKRVRLCTAEVSFTSNEEVNLAVFVCAMWVLCASIPFLHNSIVIFHKIKQKPKTKPTLKLYSIAIVLMLSHSTVCVCVLFYNWLKMEFLFDCHIWKWRENMNVVIRSTSFLWIRFQHFIFSFSLSTNVSSIIFLYSNSESILAAKICIRNETILIDNLII